MPLIARLALVLAGGAIAGSFLPHIPILLTVGSCTALLALARAREPAFLLAMALAGLALGALDATADRVKCPAIADRAPIDVTGVLQATPADAQRTVQLRATGGCMLRVRVPEDVRVRMGDEVRVRGEWMTVRITRDARPSSEGLVIASSLIHMMTPAQPTLRARDRAQQRIQELFPVAYPLAEALLIAQRENLNVDVRESFAASGLTHLLAISGTHVALVAAALLLMARLLRVSRGASALVSILGSAAYVFFLGAPFAALRALFQMALLLGARSLQRPAHPIGLLSAAAIVIIVIDPGAPLDAGFQLSFAGIFGIILWRRPLIDLMPASIPTPVRDAIATTCAATATTTPIAAFHFGTVSVISLVANLLAIPVVSLAVPTAAAALALSAIDLELARFLAAGSELTLLWLNSIAQKCAAVPGGHFAVTPLAIATSVIAVFTAAKVFSHAPMIPCSHAPMITRVVIATMAGVLPIIATPLLPLSTRALEVHMIDVGQGDAIAIRSPRGRWLLVDAGPASDRFNAGKNQVAPYLLRHQAPRVAAAILSHPHLDHFGGLAAVAQRIDVAAVMDPGLAVAGREYDALLDAAQRMHVPWVLARTGATLRLDGMVIEFLAPDSVPLDALADANEYSAVFRLTYGKFDALFLGDLPAGRESELVERFGERLDVDLLKVAHHGSGGSSSVELLLAASPAVALVPAGRRNRYGHPHSRALERLRLAGARVFRTDLDGSVTVSVDRDGLMSVRTRQ